VTRGTTPYGGVVASGAQHNGDSSRLQCAPKFLGAGVLLWQQYLNQTHLDRRHSTKGGDLCLEPPVLETPDQVHSCTEQHVCQLLTLMDLESDRDHGHTDHHPGPADSGGGTIAHSVNYDPSGWTQIHWDTSSPMVLWCLQSCPEVWFHLIQKQCDQD
jgi:hypothetical protein